MTNSKTKNKNTIIKLKDFVHCEFYTKTKTKMMNLILNSLFLYFTELKNEQIRKDFEVIKNLISHFKILNYLIKEKSFAEIDEESKQMIVEITLIAFFLGTSMETQIFENAKNLREITRLRIIRKQNKFFFGSKKADLIGFNNKTGVTTQDDFSSFSDYNNCIPREKHSEDLTKNLYNFAFKLLESLIDKFPQVFYEKKIWSKVIGENCYLSKLSSYFRKSHFIEKILIDEKNLIFENKIKIFHNDLLDTFINENKNCKSFEIKELNNFYINYIHKLIDNEESLLLLLHTSPALHVKYYLIKIFKKILNTLPLDIWLLQKGRLNMDRLAGDISNSFVSFNFILFLEILKNLNNKKYLLELVNFLTFLVEESLIFKYDFDIFIKTTEFIFFKILDIQAISQKTHALTSIYNLFSILFEKGLKSRNKISKKEIVVFYSLCKKIFIYSFEIFFQSEFLQSEEFLQKLLRVISLLFLNLPKFDLDNLIFNQIESDICNLKMNLWNIFYVLIEFFENNDNEIKIEIVNIISNIFKLFDKSSMNLNFLALKMMIAFIINKSPKMAKLLIDKCQIKSIWLNNIFISKTEFDNLNDNFKFQLFTKFNTKISSNANNLLNFIFYNFETNIKHTKDDSYLYNKLKIYENSEKTYKDDNKITILKNKLNNPTYQYDIILDIFGFILHKINRLNPKKIDKSDIKITHLIISSENIPLSIKRRAERIFLKPAIFSKESINSAIFLYNNSKFSKIFIKHDIKKFILKLFDSLSNKTSNLKTLKLIFSFLESSIENRSLSSIIGEINLFISSNENIIEQNNFILNDLLLNPQKSIFINFQKISIIINLLVFKIRF